MILRVYFIVFFTIVYLSVAGQQAETATKEAIYKLESSGFMEFRSNGWGAGYRIGKFKTGYSKRNLEFSFSVVKDLRQIKWNFTQTLSNRYYYGKMIHLYNIKALYGIQKTLTTKPYWGGVEFRRNFLYGFNLGVGVPIWVYIYNYNDANNQILVPFDPEIHDSQDIQSKGPFVKGLNDLQFYPAISFKYSISAEYGLYSELTKAVEVGLQLDLYPKAVEIMAFSTPKNYMMSGYIAFHFGKRYNK